MGKLFSKERRYLPNKTKDPGKESSKTCALSPNTNVLTSSDKVTWDHHTPFVKNISTPHSDAITCISSKSPNFSITGGKDKVIYVQNLDDNEVLHEWKEHQRDVIKVRCYDDMVASCSRDSTVCLWKFGHLNHIGKFEGHSLSVSAVDFSGTGDHLCTGSRDNSVKIWDIETEECINSNSISRNLVTDMTWSEHIIIQTSEDKTLKVWDSRILEVVNTSPVQHQILTCCAVNGNLCIMGCNGFGGSGCQVYCWDLRQHKILQEFRGHTETVSGCTFVKTGDGLRTFASCSHDGSLVLWKEGSTEPLRRKQFDDGILTGVCSLNPETILCSSFNKDVYIVKFYYES